MNPQAALAIALAAFVAVYYGSLFFYSLFAGRSFYSKNRVWFTHLDAHEYWADVRERPIQYYLTVGMDLLVVLLMLGIMIFLCARFYNLALPAAGPLPPLFGSRENTVFLIAALVYVFCVFTVWICRRIIGALAD